MDSLFELTIEKILASFLLPLIYFFHQGQRVFILYLLVAFAFGALLYWSLRKQKHPSVEKISLLAYLFPAELYAHPSTRLDFKFFYANTVFQALLLVPLATFIAPTLTLVVQGGMSQWGFPGEGAIPSHLNTWLLFTLVLAMALDFGLFFGHYLLHKIPFLWEFHKVHHTAEVMTPITVYRMHPVDNMLILVFGALCTGLLGGVLQFYMGGQGLMLQVGGVNLFFVLYYFFGYNLRHSHIWLDYGPVLSRILMSPAQHQIHHSAEPRHFDKNQGFIFSFWDALFGTLYIPNGRESFRLGIDELDDQKQYNRSLWALFWHPFENLREKFKWTHLGRPKKWAFSVLFLVPLIWGLSLNFTYTEPLAPVNPNVYLENLTWNQVQDYIESQGYTTALIPTGGTEQNGKHMVLGKHNKIVEYTAGRIAEALGNALVAPVMTYVPEGGIAPAEGHMRFSGTLSTPEPVFESVLEYAARSLKVHGFKTLCFIGDSGGNQASQKRVAEKLNAEWQDEGVTVLHVSDYYAKNGQRAWLFNQGYGGDIGTHAGIMDTSELMAVDSEGVISEQQTDNTDDDFLSVGSDGNTRSASSILGHALIEMKIRAAVYQIQHH